MLNDKVNAKDTHKILQRIYDLCNMGSAQNINNNSDLRTLYVRWQNLQRLAQTCPELLKDTDITFLLEPTSVGVGFLLQELLTRTIVQSLKVGVEVGVMRQPNTHDTGFVQNSIHVVRVPKAIRDVVGILLSIHWCCGHTSNIIPASVSERMISGDVNTLIGKILVHAARNIATIGTLNLELFHKFKQLYLDTSTNPDTRWMYDNIVLQLSSGWDNFEHSKDFIGVYTSANIESGVVDYSSIFSAFKLIVDCTNEIQEYLGGMTLSAWIAEEATKINVKVKEDDTMNSALRTLEELLKRSVVITDHGEVLNVFLDGESNAISITNRDLRDATAQFDDRPKVSSCKVLVDGTEQEIINLTDADLDAIVASMSRIVAPDATDVNYTGNNSTQPATPLQDLINNLQAQRDVERQAEAEMARRNVEQQRIEDAMAPHMGETQPTQAEPQAEEVRIVNGERQFRRVVAGITMWIPEANVQAQEARREQNQRVEATATIIQNPFATAPIDGDDDDEDGDVIEELADYVLAHRDELTIDDIEGDEEVEATDNFRGLQDAQRVREANNIPDANTNGATNATGERVGQFILTPDGRFVFQQ